MHISLYTSWGNVCSLKLDRMAGCAVLPLLCLRTLPVLTTFLTHKRSQISPFFRGKMWNPWILTPSAAPRAPPLPSFHSRLLTGSPAFCPHLLPFITTSVQPTLWERGLWLLQNRPVFSPGFLLATLLQMAVSHVSWDLLRLLSWPFMASDTINHSFLRPVTALPVSVSLSLTLHPLPRCS